MLVVETAATSADSALCVLSRAAGGGASRWRLDVGATSLLLLLVMVAEEMSPACRLWRMAAARREVGGAGMYTAVVREGCAANTNAATNTHELPLPDPGSAQPHVPTP